MLNRRLLLVLPVAVLSACGSDGGTGPGTDLPFSIAFQSAPDSVFALSDTIPLTAVVKSESGATLTGTPITYSSSAEGVAIVTSAARLVSKGVGTAQITASAGTLQATRNVVVRQKLSAVTMSRPTLRLGAGRTASFTATGVDSRGNAIAGLPSAVFSSADSTVVRVTAGGATTALRVGTSRITGRVTSPADGSKEGTADVTVVALSTSPIVGMTATSFTPATVDIAAGGTVRFANTSGIAHDVDFAGAVERIPVHTSGETSRTFATAGAYPFHCNLHGGMTGTVFVSQ